MKIKYLALLAVLLFALSSASAYNSAHTHLVGVTKSGEEMKGVVASLTVEVHNGSGRVFVETNPLTQIDTQASARLAKEVACEVLNINCSNYDFFYIVNSDYEIVGGPSAGAAMAAATIAALQGVNISKDVLITGTINPAGSIGPVGGILSKAEAAYSIGAKVLLIPKGESIYYNETTGEKINITYLAEKNWGLKVVEVDNIYQAYEYLTGYKIKLQKVSSSDIASSEYTEVMKYLSESFSDYANKSLKNAEGKFNSTELSSNFSDTVKELLSQSKENLENAKDSYKKGEFYSSSSFSVRSLIYSNYANYLIGYDESGRNKTYVLSKINNTNKTISNFEVMFLTKRKIDDYRDIEVYSVVIDRIRESEDLLKDAKEAYDSGDMDRALYLTSFAEVRKNTAYSWLLLVSKFKGNLSLEFDLNNLKDISKERIQEAKTLIVYASTVANNQVLLSAEEHLNNALDAYNNQRYVFALFEASKARAEASLAMEARGLTNETIQPEIDELENRAMVSIKLAEDKGLLPILALSYLEFGKTLAKKDPVQALVFFSYSREMSQISKDLFDATVGHKEKVISDVSIEKVENPYVNETLSKVYLIFVGALCGILVAFYLENRK